jgi:2-oxoglutarate dehydrogenase E1 component
VIDDEGFRQKPEKARKVLLCSGKIYYELAAERAANSIEDIAIVRIEQLHPMPEYQLQQIYDRYTNASFYWVQEEPKNKGAWTYLLRWEENIKRLSLISRKASASPATGFSSIHKREQQDIITKALDLNPSE